MVGILYQDRFKRRSQYYQAVQLTVISVTNPFSQKCHILNRLLYLRIPPDIFYLKYWFNNHCSNLILTRSGSTLYFSRDSDIASVDSKLDWHRKWLLKYYSYISMQCIARYCWRSRSYLYAVLYDVSSSPASRQHSLLIHSSVFFRILLEFNLLFSLQMAESLVIY